MALHGRCHSLAPQRDPAVQTHDICIGAEVLRCTQFTDLDTYPLACASQVQFTISFLHSSVHYNSCGAPCCKLVILASCFTLTTLTLTSSYTREHISG